MDNRKEGLKELAGSLAAAVIIVAVSKFLTNTVLSGVSDALYKTFCGKAAMTVLVFVAVVILKKMKKTLVSRKRPQRKLRVFHLIFGFCIFRVFIAGFAAVVPIAPESVIVFIFRVVRA